MPCKFNQKLWRHCLILKSLKNVASCKSDVTVKLFKQGSLLCENMCLAACSQSSRPRAYVRNSVLLWGRKRLRIWVTFMACVRARQIMSLARTATKITSGTGDSRTWMCNNVWMRLSPNWGVFKLKWYEEVVSFVVWKSGSKPWC